MFMQSQKWKLTQKQMVSRDINENERLKQRNFLKTNLIKMFFITSSLIVILETTEGHLLLQLANLREFRL